MIDPTKQFEAENDAVEQARDEPGFDEAKFRAAFQVGYYAGYEAGYSEGWAEGMKDGLEAASS